MFKKLGNKLAYILIGVILAIAGSVAYAANVTVPQATVKGQVPCGLTTGNYAACNLVAGSNVTISTSTTGQITITSTGGSASAGGQANQIQYNAAGALGGANLFYSSNLFGTNSTSPGSNFVVQGSSTISTTIPTFTVASSSNTILLQVGANGSTTLSSLGAGSVQSTSGGALYVTANTGSGLNVLQTSPTLVTPILGVASGTSLSISGILWGNGQSNLTTVSSTALTVSGNTVLASTTLTGTFSATGSTTLSSLGAGCVNSTSGGGLFIATCASGGSGSISTSTTAVIGKSAVWTGLATLGNGAWIDNGTVTGVNATSSTVTLNLQGNAGANSILNVASSSAVSILRVTSNSIIGINTTTPNAMLHVVSASTTITTLVAQATSSQTSAVLEIWNSTGATPMFTVVPSGNVGVNTGTPGSLFTIAGISGSTNPLLTVASSTGAILAQINPIGYGIQIGTTTANTTLFALGNSSFASNDLFGAASSSGATLFVIKNTGSVGIGTTTPAATVHVVDSAATIRIGEALSSKVGCIEMYDAAATTTLTYLYVSGTALVVTTTKPVFCK